MAVQPSDLGEFRAYLATQRDGEVERAVATLSPAELPEGDVLVRVAWSSVNYKDALATRPDGGVARTSPLVPGIDLAGEVVASDDEAVAPGQEVVAHGYEIGVARHGGFAEYARVPADWVVPLPDGLSAREAMALGTAGYTAGLSVHLLEERGLTPGDGPVLVTGASGGVGSTAVGILAERGYEVVASTGKEAEHDYLRALGASDIVGREETMAESKRPLESQRWAAAVDPVGGRALAYILRTLRYGGAVAVSGLTGGIALETTVLPFVLRGVTVLGVDSVQTPIGLRREIWRRLAGDLRPRGLDSMIREVALDGIDPVLDDIHAGRARGRTVVRVGGS
jgi:putative YhdH/YhfP family quinone oxidoreductase